MFWHPIRLPSDPNDPYPTLFRPCSDRDPTRSDHLSDHLPQPTFSKFCPILRGVRNLAVTFLFEELETWEWVRWKAGEILQKMYLLKKWNNPHDAIRPKRTQYDCSDPVQTVPTSIRPPNDQTVGATFWTCSKKITLFPTSATTHTTLFRPCSDLYPTGPKKKIFIKNSRSDDGRPSVTSALGRPKAQGFPCVCVRILTFLVSISTLAFAL